MTFYALVSLHRGTLSTVANTREDAIVQFGRALGEELSLQARGHTAEYLLDEWDQGPHLIKGRISVWKRSRARY